MKTLLKYILIFFLLYSTVIPTSADDEKNYFVTWEKPRISSVFNKADSKLVFLVQFKTHDYTTQEYKYDFQISTTERTKSCQGVFTIANTTIYTICGILISDVNVLEQEYSFYLEARDTTTNNQEIEIYETYNEGIVATSSDIHIKSSQSEILSTNSNGEDKQEGKENIDESQNNIEALQTSEIENKINTKLEIFFEKIKNYTPERKIVLINTVLEAIEKINTENEEKKIIIQLIMNKFLEEKMILQNT